MERFTAVSLKTRLLGMRTTLAFVHLLQILTWSPAISDFLGTLRKWMCNQTLPYAKNTGVWSLHILLALAGSKCLGVWLLNVCDDVRSFEFIVLEEDI